MPTEQLEWIISLPQNIAHEGRSGIDLLYTQILEQAAADVDMDGEDNEEINRCFKTVVGTVLLVFNPLSARAFLDLLIVSNITTLHSFLIPDGPEDPIYIFHKSFPGFLTDHKQCKDNWFLLTQQSIMQKFYFHAST